jgi:hypothetical protein
MELLNLPTETLENIVHDAFGERGLMKGVALRLLNSKCCWFPVRYCTDVDAKRRSHGQ